jgi:hypothetical protein
MADVGDKAMMLTGWNKIRIIVDLNVTVAWVFFLYILDYINVEVKTLS